MKRLVLSALIALSVYFALFGGEYSVFEVRRVRAERVVLQERLVALERTNDCLRAWAEALQSDSATIERLTPSKVKIRSVAEVAELDGGSGVSLGVARRGSAAPDSKNGFGRVGEHRRVDADG